MTLYRHFASKDVLVAACLSELTQEFDAAWDALAAAHVGDPEGQLLAWLRHVGDFEENEAERGCALANAAVELPDKDHRSRPSSWWRFGTLGRGALTQWRRWKVVCSRCGCGQRSTAWRIVQRAQCRYQALRLTAHRCAAAGLDSGTAPAVLASMPSTAEWVAWSGSDG